MEINWFTVIAQVINFFILVWLLKRFLYKPILRAIDERESKIATQLKEAEVKKAEALKEQKDFEQKNRAFNQDKKDRIDKMIEETNEERQKLMDKARVDAEVLSKKLVNAAQKRHHEEQMLLNRKILEEVFAISSKALTDLASSDLEELLVEAFTKRLMALEGNELKNLKMAFKSSSEKLLVRTAFPLTAKQQKELNQAFDEVLDSETSIKFEVTPILIGGIELSTHEFKLAWSISEYLHAFEKSISKTTQTKTVPLIWGK